MRGHIIRLRADGGRVVFAEPIYSTGTRIREITEAPDGRIVLFQDGGAISFIVLVPAPADRDADRSGRGKDRGDAPARM